MNKFVILLIVGALVNSTGNASAQELIAAPPGGAIDSPPQLELPSVPAVGSGSRGTAANAGSGARGMEAPSGSTPLTQDVGLQPIPTEPPQDGLQGFGSEEAFHVLQCEPALLESTGTWLRRGFWYSEVDALLMDLIWRRDDDVIMQSTNSLDALVVQGGRQGAEGMPRLKLGRFLFRDHKNRDHVAEFITFGGGQWSRGGRLDAAPGNTLIVNQSFTNGFGQIGIAGNTSFNGATSTEFEYDSRVNSFELNYHVKARMRKDRMELEPNGQWVRRAQPSISRSLMAGIRYIDVTENVNWNAFGIDDDADANTAAQTGNYRVLTDNDLIGTQVGFSWAYETARWSLGLHAKGGMFLNHTDVDSSFAVTGGLASGGTDATVDNISFMTEGALTGKWHLTPNFSLRAGMEILFVSSLAHAVDQINFAPNSSSQVVSSGDSAYMGGIIGFERYW